MIVNKPRKRVSSKTDQTEYWCETAVCEAVRHRSQFVPSRSSPSLLAAPSDGRRTRYAPLPSTWITEKSNKSHNYQKKTKSKGKKIYSTDYEYIHAE